MKPTTSKTGRYPYTILNRVFLIILISILAYSAFFPPEKNHPIPSGSRFFSNSEVPSTGLSRSFSAIMRFQFHDASHYNPHGMRLFLFFFIQVFMRMAALELAGRLPEKTMKTLFYMDAALSAALFVTCFWPFFIALYTNSHAM